MSYARSAAQVLGITGAGFVTGMIASFTIVSVPTVTEESADSAARLWKKFYDIGARLMPPLAITCSTCFAYLAYDSRNLMRGKLPVSAFALYTAAAIAVPSIIPFTLLGMWDTVKSLEKRAASAPDAPSDSETKQLVTKWSRLNVGRVLLAGSAALLSGTAALAPRGIDGYVE